MTHCSSYGGRLNLFLKEWAPGAELPGLKTPIARAYLMADSARTALPVAGNRINLPGQGPPGPWPVVIVEFDSQPVVG